MSARSLSLSFFPFLDFPPFSSVFGGHRPEFPISFLVRKSLNRPIGVSPFIISNRRQQHSAYYSLQQVVGVVTICCASAQKSSLPLPSFLNQPTPRYFIQSPSSVIPSNRRRNPIPRCLCLCLCMSGQSCKKRALPFIRAITSSDKQVTSDKRIGNYCVCARNQTTFPSPST